MFIGRGDDEERGAAYFFCKVSRALLAAVAVWVDGGGFEGGEDFAAEAIDDHGRPCFYIGLPNPNSNGVRKGEFVGLEGGNL